MNTVILTGAKKYTNQGSVSRPGKFPGRKVITWELALSLAKDATLYRMSPPEQVRRNIITDLTDRSGRRYRPITRNPR